MTIANTIKSLGARAMMSKDDIRHVLKEDHEQFKTWTKTMVEGKRTTERARAFAQLKPSLTAHARVEEVIAYNAIIGPNNDAETDTLGREGYVEHHISDHLVQRLSDLDPRTDDWRAHAKVLHELLGHHIDEEESDIFAKLGAKFSREQLETMGLRFRRDKATFLATGNRPKRANPPKGSSATKRAKRRGVTKAAKRVPKKSVSRKKTVRRLAG
jgi:Hemerythrin HHE cation binding domain